MSKPRKQTYTLEMYLKKINDSDIRSDQDVQRLAGQWNNNMNNELITTVLTGDYIPPIILGQESSSQMWVIDGLQRSTTLSLFRYGNYRITSSVEQPIITYRAKVKDAEGNIEKDENGDIIWEEKEFDVRNKTYNKLPEELKKAFNEYQIETVIHENYNMKQISKLVRRYNNHTSMKTSQKAFTYIDNFAREIRDIMGMDFFSECGSYTARERLNGTLERVIIETLMCMFHFSEWNKQSQKNSIFLNENATVEELYTLKENLYRLERIITENLRNIFNSKNSFLWFTLFHKFTFTGLEDNKFADFLQAFQEELCQKEVDGTSYAMVDENRNTKDKALIIEKLTLLETLMCDYLHINKENLQQTTSEEILTFIKENVNPDVVQEDLELYQDMLNDFREKYNRDGENRIFDRYNHTSLLAIIAYSFLVDFDIEKWLQHFLAENDSYITDQKENYAYMKYDVDEFKKSAASITNIAESA